jgi:hypothetical protein
VKTLGVFIRIQGGAYVAGFALVEDDRLLRDDRFPAPPDEDAPRQFAELYKHTRDSITQFAVESVALKESEIQGGGRNATIAHRAEGAALAAAGEIRNLEVTLWLGSRMWRPAGFTKRPSNIEVIAALWGQLDQEPASDETKQAAAAARAGILVRQ